MFLDIQWFNVTLFCIFASGIPDPMYQNKFKALIMFICGADTGTQNRDTKRDFILGIYYIKIHYQ